MPIRQPYLVLCANLQPFPDFSKFSQRKLRSIVPSDLHRPSDRGASLVGKNPSRHIAVWHRLVRNCRTSRRQLHEPNAMGCTNRRAQVARTEGHRLREPQGAESPTKRGNFREIPHGTRSEVPAYHKKCFLFCSSPALPYLWTSKQRTDAFTRRKTGGIQPLARRA